MSKSESLSGSPSAQSPTQGTLKLQTDLVGSAGNRLASYELHSAIAPSAHAARRIDATSPSPFLVGSSEACALRVQEPTLSRRHAAFEVRVDGLWVTDLDSRNGTFINGVRIKEARIDDEALIELGALKLVAKCASGLSGEPPLAQGFGSVVGASVQMRRLYPLCEKIANSGIAVVIEGETGTGKEAMAEALHAMGPRADKPFVVFDCTAISANLIEAELFGHEKGAFTGADRRRVGVFQQADGGTLFIDEIGDLELHLQAKLLRVIDRNEVRPIGSARTEKVDVRIIAATRRDLDREVQMGRFRDDLFHRLAIGRIELPPLRKRTGDVMLLAKRFWQDLGGNASELPITLLARWEAEPWPGNVRELRNTVAKHLALGELANLPPAPADDPVRDVDGDLFEGLEVLPLAEARAAIIERFERDYLRRVLKRTGGNVTQAAQHAGVARRYFHILKAKHISEDNSEK